jgi:hypothetical protein
MSAGISIGKEDFDLSNGAIKDFTAALARTARSAQLTEIASALEEEVQGWFQGKYVFLDSILDTAEKRAAFIPVIRPAADIIRLEADWSEWGLGLLEKIVIGMTAALQRPTAAA